MYDQGTLQTVAILSRHVAVEPKGSWGARKLGESELDNGVSYQLDLEPRTCTDTNCLAEWGTGSHRQAHQPKHCHAETNHANASNRLSKWSHSDGY